MDEVGQLPPQPKERTWRTLLFALATAVGAVVLGWLYPTPFTTLIDAWGYLAMGLLLCVIGAAMHSNTRENGFLSSLGFVLFAVGVFVTTITIVWAIFTF